MGAAHFVCSRVKGGRMFPWSGSGGNPRARPVAADTLLLAGTEKPFEARVVGGFERDSALSVRQRPCNVAAASNHGGCSSAPALPAAAGRCPGFRVLRLA